MNRGAKSFDSEIDGLHVLCASRIRAACISVDNVVGHLALQSTLAVESVHVLLLGSADLG